MSARRTGTIGAIVPSPDEDINHPEPLNHVGIAPRLSHASVHQVDPIVLFLIRTHSRVSKSLDEPRMPLEPGMLDYSFQTSPVRLSGGHLVGRWQQGPRTYICLSLPPSVSLLLLSELS